MVLNSLTRRLGRSSLSALFEMYSAMSIAAACVLKIATRTISKEPGNSLSYMVTLTEVDSVPEIAQLALEPFELSAQHGELSGDVDGNTQPCDQKKKGSVWSFSRNWLSI